MEDRELEEREARQKWMEQGSKGERREADREVRLTGMQRSERERREESRSSQGKGEAGTGPPASLLISCDSSSKCVSVSVHVVSVSMCASEPRRLERMQQQQKL